MREQYSQLARYYQMSDYQIWRNAFESTVVRTAALSAMDKSGWAPPTDLVDKKVAELPQFQENGRFSVIKYRQMDAASRLSLWQDMRDDLTVDRYRNDVSNIKVSQGETDFVGLMAGGQRKFKMAALSYASYPADEIRKFAEAHPELFKTVHLSQITVSSGEKEAQTILSDIRTNKTTFEDAARTLSEDAFADRGGDAGSQMLIELASQISDYDARTALANLPAGGLSEALTIPSGWAIFRANEDAKDSDLNDAAVLDKIRSYMMNAERGVIEDWLLAQAEDFAERARQSGFEAVAAVREIALYDFGALPVNYGDSALFSTLTSFSGPNFQTASTDENFWKIAFSTPVGTPSNPLVLGGNEDNVVVLYPEEEITDDEAAVENSKNTFSSWWAENETQGNITSAVLHSKRFDDQFLNTYIRLFVSGS
jgi:hypothetical protein